MNAIDKLKNVINNRICTVIAKGKSLEPLEQCIHLLKNYDICWSTQNQFEYIENALLAKINKKFDLLSDCSTVGRKEFESEVRIPRFLNFMQREENNLLMISELTKQQCFTDNNRNDIVLQFADKIITIDELFSLPQAPKEIWDPPPNSLTLLLAFLIAGGAKKIICFGFDGMKYNKNTDHLYSYYQHEFVALERKAAYGDLRDGSLHVDTLDFNRRFKEIFQIYKNTFNNRDVEIINCSPNSEITIFQKIDYNLLQGVLDRWTQEQK